MKQRAPYLRRRTLTPNRGASVMGSAVLTSEYKINYLVPTTGEMLEARASVVYAGKRQAVCRCDVFALSAGWEEAFCATAQGTIAAPVTEGRKAGGEESSDP